MRHQYHVDPSEAGEGGIDHRALAGKIGNIQCRGLDPSRSPDSKVVCNRDQAAGIPARQEKMGSLFGEFLSRFTRDSRRRAHDEHPQRRARPR